MKKLIPIIAIAVAMVLPAVMSAQTLDYYGYENSDLPTLISWIEDGINSGFVTFDTQQHEDEFLALAANLYSVSAVHNWSQCEVICGMLKQAAANIVGTSHREMADWLCEIAAWAYTDEAVLLLTPLQVADMLGTFVKPPTDETLSNKDETLEHVGSQADGDWCHNWMDDSDLIHHIGICDEVAKVYNDKH